MRHIFHLWLIGNPIIKELNPVHVENYKKGINMEQYIMLSYVFT